VIKNKKSTLKSVKMCQKIGQLICFYFLEQLVKSGYSLVYVALKNKIF